MTAPEVALPADQAERDRIINERDETLFVAAGAGSGKTRALVDRVERLVLDDNVEMESIAAITFTEKAAAELRDKIRARFEACANDPAPARAARAATALTQLDGAAVGTLHSFAQRILNEHPVQAGLPPGVEVLDEIGSQVEFEARWHEFLDALLDNEAMAPSILALEAVSVKLDSLRQLALQMTDNWDLVQSRLRIDAPPPPPFDRDGLIAEFDRIDELRKYCLDPDDTGLKAFAKVHAGRARLVAAIDDVDAMAVARSLGKAQGEPGKKIGSGTGGRAANWEIEKDVLKSSLTGLATTCDSYVARVTQAALEHIGGQIGDFVVRMAIERQQSGRLEFHDLLVHARRVLTDPDHGSTVRAELRERYQRLLLDEFQDTDPIQIQIAALIAATDSDVAGKEWSELDIEPGRLFLVGDPKQSIYRFRRADIAVYLAAQQRFPGGPELTVNFRTVAPVINWVNHVFGALISEEPGSQPAYVPLSSHRGAGAPNGPGVALLGAEEVPERRSAAEMREAEAADIAATIATAVHGPNRWDVLNEDTDEPDGSAPRWRPAVPSDVCILLPARTSLPFIERALDQAGISYRAETSSLVYATREVRELMLALRAVADPTDELATVAALRSFVYGCGDDDLAHWKLGLGGRFSPRAPLPEGAAGHPVGDGLAHLASLHEARLWSNPAELLDRLVRERGVLETAIATGAPRDVWRRLRFVMDQARAWIDAGGRDLRAYLQWARLQGAENARVSETVLPETDDDSVRIMTIHGAKGLEFPITILAGMTTQVGAPRRSPAVHFPTDGSEPLYWLTGSVKSDGFDVWKPIDEQMDEHERLRLLYVAATRARDHLVVSLHRFVNSNPTGATILAQTGDSAPDAVAFAAPPLDAALTAGSVPATAPMPDRTAWASERAAALAEGGRRTVIAATTLAREASEAAAASPELSDGGLDKRPRDLDLPPWQKGRYGTAVGRAVHGVMQVVDLSSGAGLDDAARAQAMAEGVANRTEVVARLARSGLETASARSAAGAEHWRELWVAAPIGNHLIEGYVDLLYRADDGLVIVDWKTDHVEGDSDVAAKLDRYRLQGASYAAAVEAATGESVSRMVFAFLNENGATEAELPDLRAAIDEVRSTAAQLAEASARVVSADAAL